MTERGEAERINLSSVGFILAGAGLNQSQEQRTPSRSHTWASGIQMPEPFSVTFPRALAEDWIGNRMDMA